MPWSLLNAPRAQNLARISTVESVPSYSVLSSNGRLRPMLLISTCYRFLPCSVPERYTESTLESSCKVNQDRNSWLRKSQTLHPNRQWCRQFHQAMPRSQPPPENERRFICGNQEYRSLSHCFFHVLRSRKASLLIRTRCTGPSHHLLQIRSIFLWMTNF